MKDIFLKITATILLVSFTGESACYGLATLPASQSPAAKREILPELYIHGRCIRVAESPDDLTLLRHNGGAPCLLLSCGRYLVKREVAHDSVALLGAIYRKDAEALMQILEQTDAAKYGRIQDAILQSLPKPADASVADNVYANRIAAGAFEWIILVKEGVIRDREVPEDRKGLVSAFKRIMADNEDCFTGDIEFLDGGSRADAIRGALNAGMRFYEPADGTGSSPAKDLSRGQVDEIAETHPALEKAANDGRMFALFLGQLDALPMPELRKGFLPKRAVDDALADMFLGNLIGIRDPSATRDRILQKIRDRRFRLTLFEGLAMMRRAFREYALPEDRPVRLCVVIEDTDLPSIVFKDADNSLMAHAGEGGKTGMPHLSLYVGYGLVDLLVRKRMSILLQGVVSRGMHGIIGDGQDQRADRDATEAFNQLLRERKVFHDELARATSGYPRHFDDAALGEAIEAIASNLEWFDLVRDLTKRLADDAIPFCAVLRTGIRIAVLTADGDRAAFEMRLLALEAMARRLAAAGIDPNETLEEAKELTRFMYDHGNFAEALQVAQNIPALYKRFRDAGHSDTKLRQDMRWAMRSGIVQSLPDAQSVIKLEERMLRCPALLPITEEFRTELKKCDCDTLVQDLADAKKYHVPEERDPLYEYEVRAEGRGGDYDGGGNLTNHYTISLVKTKRSAMPAAITVRLFKKSGDKKEVMAEVVRLGALGEDVFEKEIKKILDASAQVAPEENIIITDIVEDGSGKKPKNLSRGQVDEMAETHPALEKAANDGRMFALMREDLDRGDLLTMADEQLAELFVGNLTGLQVPRATTERIIALLKTQWYRRDIVRGLSAMRSALEGVTFPAGKPVRLALVQEEDGLPALVYTDRLNNLIAHAGSGEKTHMPFISIYAGKRSSVSYGREWSRQGYAEMIRHEAEDVIRGHHAGEETTYMKWLYSDAIVDMVRPALAQELSDAVSVYPQPYDANIFNKLLLCGFRYHIEWFDRVKRFVARLAEDHVPFCAAVSAGIPLAVVAAGEDDAAFDRCLAALDRLARDLAQRRIDPHKTLEVASMMRRFIASPEDFERALALALEIPAIFKRYRDSGVSTAMMQMAMRTLVLSDDASLQGICANLDDVDEMVRLEKRTADRPFLVGENMPVSSKKVDTCTCADLDAALAYARKKYLPHGEDPDYVYEIYDVFNGGTSIGTEPVYSYDIYFTKYKKGQAAASATMRIYEEMREVYGQGEGLFEKTMEEVRRLNRVAEALAEAAQGYPASFRKDVLDGAAHAIARYPAFAQPLIAMTKRLANDGVPFCAVLGRGVELAVSIASGDADDFERCLAGLEALVRALAASRIDPFETLEEAHEVAALMKGPEEFGALLAVARRIPALFKSYRDKGCSDAALRGDLSELVRAGIVQDLDGLAALLDVEERILARPALVPVELEVSRGRVATCECTNHGEVLASVRAKYLSAAPEPGYVYDILSTQTDTEDYGKTIFYKYDIHLVKRKKSLTSKLITSRIFHKIRDAAKTEELLRRLSVLPAEKFWPALERAERDSDAILAGSWVAQEFETGIFVPSSPVFGCLQEKGRQYTVRYADRALSAGERKTVRRYVRLLQKLSKATIVLEKDRGPVSASWPSFSVSCTDADGKYVNNGYISMHVPSGKPRTCAVRTLSMLNIAFAAASLPQEISSGRLDDRQHALIQYVETAYKLLTGKRLALHDWPYRRIQDIGSLSMDIPETYAPDDIGPGAYDAMALKAIVSLRGNAMAAFRERMVGLRAKLRTGWSSVRSVVSKKPADGGDHWVERGMRERAFLVQDLLHDDLQRGREEIAEKLPGAHTQTPLLYTIRYDGSRLSHTQVGTIKAYAALLGNKSSACVVTRPHSRANGSKEPLIVIVREGEDFRGEGRVDVRVPAGQEDAYILRILDMLNMALAASGIPDEVRDGKMNDQARRLVKYVESQYKAIMGTELPFSDGLVPEKLLERIKNIILELPASYRKDGNRLRDYDELTKKTLYDA